MEEDRTVFVQTPETPSYKALRDYQQAMMDVIRGALSVPPKLLRPTSLEEEVRQFETQIIRTKERMLEPYLNMVMAGILSREACLALLTRGEKLLERYAMRRSQRRLKAARRRCGYRRK